MPRFSFFAPLAAVLLLAACGVDTTGLSADSSRGPHPQTSASATVTVTEYADLECPACAAAHERIVQPLIQQYGSRIRFEFKHFPLMTIHRFALSAAEGAECAADQGKFWEFEQLAFEKQASLSTAALPVWAEELGLDIPLFERCVASHIKRETILNDQNQGRQMGVQGTPTFFVNGERVESDLATLSSAIDAALQAPSQAL